jgi:hypothetical protein
MPLVLGVLGCEVGDWPESFGIGGKDACPAIDASPPQRGPVLLVVIGEQRNTRVALDVAEALEARSGGLRLVVDGNVDAIVVDGERDRHQVRAPILFGGGQPGDARPGQQRSGLALSEVHVPTVPARDAEHSANPVDS